MNTSLPTLSALAVLGSAAAAQSDAVLQPSPSGPHRVQGLLPEPWAATWGGGGFDSAAAIENAADGDLWVAGSTRSFGASMDAWVARLDRDGAFLWELLLGGAADDEVTSLVPTADGGCVVAGATASSGAGGADGWIAKLAADGAVEWQRTYGGALDEAFRSIAASPGGYYVGGTRVATPGALLDLWVLEIDSSGDVLWQKTVGGVGDDALAEVASAPGGPIVVAASNSSLGGVPVPFFRPWLIKLDDTGDVEWQKTYNASGGDIWTDIAVLDGGGYLVTGEVLAMAFFRGDVWVLRLGASGEIEWDRRLGDNFATFWVDGGAALSPTPSGGAVIAGLTGTAGAGGEDLWVMELSATGSLAWDHVYGGAGIDNATAVTRTAEGDVVVAGFSSSFGGGGSDALILRLGDEGEAGACDLVSPTLPNKWTDGLLVEVPTVSPVDTAVVPARASLGTAFVGAAEALCSSD